MKIKIDKEGNLWIERAGVLKLQGCHMSPPMIVDGEYKTRTCSDSCPCFNDSMLPKTLELCRSFYDLGLETIDERGNGDLDQ